MSQTLITTASINDLGSIPGNVSSAVLVTDVNVGGVFNFVATGLSVNNGTVFSTSTTGFWVRQISDGEGLNVRWFGAIPDYTTPGASTDNKAAIENCVASLNAGQEIIIPEGKYYISSLNLNLPNKCTLTQKGTFYSDSTTVAILVGPTSGNVSGYNISGLSVLFSSSTFSSSNIGIKIQNTYTSEIEIKEVYGFGTGILIFGNDTGNVYNKYYLGYLYDNGLSLSLDHTNLGWVNENMFFGGHFAFTSLFTHAQVHLNVTTTSSNAINNNRFLFPSFESAVTGTTPKAAVIGGLFNYILYPRYEFKGSSSSIVAFEFSSGSQYNEIIGGFTWESSQISNLSTHNNWHSKSSIMQSGGNATSPLMTLISYNTSATKLIDILNSSGNETFYVLGTGQLTSSSFGSFAQGIKIGTTSQASLLSGLGTPNGHVTADTGSIYINTAGGSGISLWIKESGTGTNTGWISYSAPPVTGTFTANGGSTSYNIAHNLSSTPSYFSVTPTSNDAALNFYVTANSSSITVHYISAPPVGINNISMNWQANI